MAEPEEVEHRRYEKIVRETNTDKFWAWTITRVREPGRGDLYYSLQMSWGRRGATPQLGDREVGTDLGLLTWKATRKAEVKLSEGYQLTVQRTAAGTNQRRFDAGRGPVTLGSAFTGPAIGRTGFPDVVVGVDWGAGEGPNRKKKPRPEVRAKEEPVEPLVRERRVKLPD